MKKIYKYALFDWDGCLADTLNNAKKVYQLLAARNGKDFGDDTFREVVGDWGRSAKILGFEDVKELESEWIKLIENNLSEIKLNPNAKELLMILHQAGIPIGIVTSSSRYSIIQQAAQNGVNNYIDNIIGIEDVQNAKPDPEPLEKVLALFGADKASSIMIGDTEKDIIAAGRAGIDSIWYSPAVNLKIYGPRNFPEYTPTYEVKDLLEIKNFFDPNSL